MNPPPGFHSLTSGLHQDALVFAEGDPEKLVENCLGFVPAQQKAELKLYLAKMLDSKTPAELKGILNREKRDIGFGSKGASTFFTIALAKLSAS